MGLLLGARRIAARHAHEISLGVSLEFTKIQKNMKKEYYETNVSSRCL